MLCFSCLFSAFYYCFTAKVKALHASLNVKINRVCPTPETFTCDAKSYLLELMTNWYQKLTFNAFTACASFAQHCCATILAPSPYSKHTFAAPKCFSNATVVCLEFFKLWGAARTFDISPLDILLTQCFHKQRLGAFYWLGFCITYWHGTMKRRSYAKFH